MSVSYDGCTSFVPDDRCIDVGDRLGVPPERRLVQEHHSRLASRRIRLCAHPSADGGPMDACTLIIRRCHLILCVCSSRRLCTAPPPRCHASACMRSIEVQCGVCLSPPVRARRSTLPAGCCSLEMLQFVSGCSDVVALPSAMLQFRPNATELRRRDTGGER